MTDASSREPAAWVRDEGERRHVEGEMRQRVGRRIERVRYAEIAYHDPSSPVWPGPTFDSLDFGLELELDDGSTWSVAWEQADYNEGIVAFAGWHEYLRAESSAVWEVTDHWRENGPGDVAAVTPIWQRPYGDESDLCLVTLILVAENGRQAVITLGERNHKDGSLRPSGDNLAVFFSSYRARRRVVLESDADTTH